MRHDCQECVVKRSLPGLAIVLASVITISAPAALGAESFDYPGFADSSRLQLNRKAQVVQDPEHGSVLRLTESRKHSGGSAFQLDKISLAADASFSTYFRFRMHGGGGVHCGNNTGADGLVFVVETQANDVGGRGGGIGYRGIKPSLGVEFDTYSNPSDHGCNHVGINLDGDPKSVSAMVIDTPLDNGEVWHAWVDYRGRTKTVEVRIAQSDARPPKPLVTHEVDLARLLGRTDVYVGFTAATGSGFNNHDILVWNFKGFYEPIGAPKQGSLRVVGQSPEVSSPSQVALILDASGSMRGKTSDGTIKIDAAKQVLRSVIDKLPEGTQVGLRVYGHRIPYQEEKRSCRDSELVVPFGPINKKQLLRAIDGIKPQGQTPIGYSLLRLPEDFGRVEGYKLVVLVSDGGETCDPDPDDPAYPPKIVRRLLDAGVKMRVNVVGFDIEKDEVREFLKKIADNSNGNYFDARSGKDLENSIQRAMSVRFVAKEAGGKIVAEGSIGADPVSVPIGIYSLEIDTDPPTTVTDVTVENGKEVQIVLAMAGKAISVEQKVIDLGAPTASGQSQASAASLPSPTPSSSWSSVAAAPDPTEALQGVPDVLDTGTLVLGGTMVQLLGVKGELGSFVGQLMGFIAGRQVTCQPEGATEYRCTVGGEDLSRVVLYNGGAKSKSDVPADLKAAEDHARSNRLGVWR